MLTLQSSKSRNVCLLMFEVKRDSLGDVILLTSQCVFFTEVQEVLILRVLCKNTNTKRCTNINVTCSNCFSRIKSCQNSRLYYS